MKLTDERIREALDHRLSALNDPMRPVRIMNRIAEEEAIYMKKKMSRALALAVMSVLVLTTAALAATGNLFELFGQRDPRYTHVAGQATISTTDAPGTMPLHFDSAYYDGLSLTATIAAENPPEVSAYTPTAEELAAMMPASLSEDAPEALQEAMQNGTPYGYKVTTYDPVTYVTTEDGIEIPLSSGDEAFDEQGRWLAIREFDLPLPEALRNLPAITLRNEIMRVQSIWYYDGETLYRSGGAGESAGFITATVPMAAGAQRHMTGSSIVNGTAVTASADVTAMAAVVTLSAEGELTVGDLLPADQQPPEGIDASDIWVEVTALDEAWQLFRALGGLSPDEPLPVTIPFLGTADLPEMMIVEIKLQWAGEGNDGWGFQLELAHEDPSTQPLREGPPVRPSNIVYDGLSLRAELMVINPPVVTAFTPTDQELADMQLVDPGELAQWATSPAEAQAVQSLQAAMQQGIPYGYRMWRYLPGDRITDKAFLEIPVETIETRWDAHGRFVQTYSFALPLPEALRNLPAITIVYDIERQDTRWYFDGERLYAEGLGVSRAHVIVQEMAYRIPGALREMTGSTALGDATMTATADVSAMAAVITLTADADLTVSDLLPADQQPPEGTDPSDIWVEVTAKDEAGRSHRGIEGLLADQALPVTIPLLGVGELPERLTLEIKLQWEGEGNAQTGYTMVLEQQ
ncbi:MAG: hypothetical protein LBN04_10310 [Oscillospiraceae bacterium]|jgi:hypothetical protein|nr:hypothetical protein [Oscillospiraceae bacterium]